MEAPATGAPGVYRSPDACTTHMAVAPNDRLPVCQDDATGDSIFGPTACRSAHGRSLSAPPPTVPARPARSGGEGFRGVGGQRRVTPRQTCPRPDGFGRNLRSKTRWFTGFCNSHQVSHFATFFIDARAEISVAESRSVYSNRSRGNRRGTVTVSGAPMAGDRLVVLP